MEKIGLTIKERYLNLPNYITIGRIWAVGILMLVMLFLDDKNPDFEKQNRILSLISVGIFIFAMLSDLVDGALARRWNLISVFGQFFDPLADQLLFLVTMVFLVSLGRLPAWIVCLFLAREVIVTALRGVAVDEGIVIAASHWGKYKTAFVSCTTGALLIHYPLFGINMKVVGWILIWPALIFSCLSGIHYTWGFVSKLKKLHKEGV